MVKNARDPFPLPILPWRHSAPSLFLLGTPTLYLRCSLIHTDGFVCRLAVTGFQTSGIDAASRREALSDLDSSSSRCHRGELGYPVKVIRGFSTAKCCGLCKASSFALKQRLIMTNNPLQQGVSTGLSCRHSREDVSVAVILSLHPTLRSAIMHRSFSVGHSSWCGHPPFRRRPPRAA
jgi:hypothetical protein